MNRHGIVTHNVAAMRARPDSGSEQISQAILGDTVEWLEERDDYVQVRTPDAYEGWIWRPHLCLIPAPSPNGRFWPFDTLPKRARVVTADFADLRTRPGDAGVHITRLTLGSWVRKLEKVKTSDGFWCRVAVPHGPEGLIEAYVSAPLISKAAFDSLDGRAACDLALRFIGTPYLWGGTTPFGFDCSGFVQRIYSLLGVTLPRDAYLQAASPLGHGLPDDAAPQAGDLVFFRGGSDPLNRGITHVGMVLDADRYIHATGKEGVIVTRFDDPYYGENYTRCGAWRIGRRK